MDKNSKTIAAAMQNGAPQTTQVGAYNTYIGARYVPVFATPTQWNPNTAYEPLTIVTNEGNSYTSKQFVPAGIAITNDTYWELTGNFNSQVEAYRQEVQRVADDLEVFEASVEADIMELKNNLKPTAIIIGDSYCTSYEKDGSAVTPWSTQIQSFSPGWTWLGTFASNGAGFGTASPNNYTTLANNAVSALTTEQRAKVNYILISGGSNDINSGDVAIDTGINAVDSVLRENFPNAEIHFFQANFIGTTNLSSLVSNVYGYYTNKMPTKGWKVHQNIWKCLNCAYWMASDKTHPNNQGQSKLARSIISTLNGTTTQQYKENVVNFTGVITGSSYLVDDGIVINTTQRTLTQNITYGYTDVEVGEVTEPYIFWHNNYHFELPVFVTVNEKWQPLTLQCHLEKTITGVNSSGTGQFTCKLYARLPDTINETGETVSVNTTATRFLPYYAFIPYLR